MLTDDRIAEIHAEILRIPREADIWSFARAIEAETLKAHQQAIEAAVLAEREALARRADSIGHHWSGAPATAFFKFAEEIRARTQPMRIPDAHKED